jgi:glutamate-1-semialdehyde 2,1-aminomutase
MGLILPENNFLSEIRKITKDNDIPLIFDEVVTGFRISPGGAQQHFGIKPDITTLAKALGSGFVVAAVGGKKEIMDLLSPGGKVYQASTYAGNPISVSAAIASIKTLNKIKNTLYSKLEQYNAMLTHAIDDMTTDLKIPHQINFTSSMFQIFFTDKPVVDYRSSKNADAKKFKKMFSALLKKGIFIAPSQFEVVFLSDAHAKTDLEYTMNAYDAALKSVKN